MVRRVEVAEIVLWNRVIGAIAWDADKGYAHFEYAPEFLRSRIQLAPLTMPLPAQKSGAGIFSFPQLSRVTYHGMPGLIADSLPDKFGNAIIDQWLVRQGRAPDSFTPVERLCYIGYRGMGALEYKPAIKRIAGASVPLELDALVELADRVLNRQTTLQGEADELDELIRVGTSAAGARAKAVIAWNPRTNKIRSGQVMAPKGYEYWLLKFDGVGNRDKELTDPTGYGKIEYAYYLMATAAGIEMSQSRLHEEHGRHHFMTKRFDRIEGQDQFNYKLHMQSLCALAHYDFNLAGGYGYEQALAVMQQLKLPMPRLAQLYRRAVFNIVARNQDDHTKNIAFLMDKRGQWELAPAFDLTYAYNPEGQWTGQHQMTLNGKQDNFSPEDLYIPARQFRIPKCEQIVEEVLQTVSQWRTYAQQAGVDGKMIEQIAKTHRLRLTG
ncbi:MAG TPA: type II toxin-antitoxin system HipA family toxin [Gammaproteobacteria bacterium]|nr:type II toxin-antitoxin system HipA family toxin [Gammaproteobacteria bacterium]